MSPFKQFEFLKYNSTAAEKMFLLPSIGLTPHLAALIQRCTPGCDMLQSIVPGTQKKTASDNEKCNGNLGKINLD